MIRNRNPENAAIAVIAVAAAPENGRERKNRRSISGSARLGSHPSSAARAATAIAKQPRISADDQPRDGPSMMA